MKIPSLGYALLGLLHGKPSSGYDLRKIFSSTSMRTYSDSPGAIYPALKRLQKQGLIVGKVEEGSGLRRRQIFRISARGIAELKKWITAPVTPEDVAAGASLVMLRFAFSETVAGPSATLALLRSLEAALTPQLAALRTEFESLKKIAPTSGRLAFECGLRGTETFLHWTQSAITTYEQLAAKRGGTV